MILILFIYHCLSLDINIPFYGNDSKSPSSDNEKAQAIEELITSKAEKCYEDLDEKINCMCVNLDSQKRKSLAISIMICEHIHDQRTKELPTYVDDEQFISELTGDNFRIFTSYFTFIDSLCFHHANEQVSAINLQKILNVYKAVTLSTEFLIAARDNLDQTTKSLRTRLIDVQDQIFNQAASISNMTELIKNTTEKLIEITNQVSIYKNSITNAKYYFTAIGLSIVASLIFTNVFMPVLFVTGVFLFIEINVQGKYSQYITGKPFIYTYASLCILIFLLSVWDQVGLIRVKFLDVFKKKPSKKMPRIS